MKTDFDILFLRISIQFYFFVIDKCAVVLCLVREKVAVVH